MIQWLNGHSLCHSEHPYFEVGENPARVQVRSVATDMPHTPSPPSSPDSVVFIANKSPLPEGFLRKNVRSNLARTPEPRDDGKVYHHRWVLAHTKNISLMSTRLDRLGKISSETYSCLTRSSIIAICQMSLVSVIRCTLYYLLKFYF